MKKNLTIIFLIILLNLIGLRAAHSVNPLIGLEGDADLNKDRTITNGELIAYMDDNVSQKASELGRQQNPTLTGNPDQILARY